MANTGPTVRRTQLSSEDFEDLGVRAKRSLSAQPRPFIRWAGSKRGLLAHLIPVLPRSYRRYYEPFLGSGALFFLLRPKTAVLNDRCAELIDTYTAVRDHPRRVADAALAIPFDKVHYYEIRASRAMDRTVRAGEFLFLNRACFNGLYRVNSRGEFNVPWGAPKTQFVVDKDNLAACSDALRGDGVELTSVDFAESLRSCRTGDLVFLDPPYVTTHNANGFIDYNERLFSWSDQVRLAQKAEALRQRGCHVLVTNALHPDVLALYPRFHRVQIDRQSTLASSSRKRGPVSEVILVGARDEA